MTTFKFTTLKMTDAEVADQLDKTADYIVAHGWVQRVGQDRLGRVCVAQAMDIVSPRSINDAVSLGLWDAFCDYLGTNPIIWNDAEGRTQEEVIQALRDAAIKRRSDEFRSLIH